MRLGARKLNPVVAARAGARIVRRQGIDRVTMRSVAAAIGVTPMALYRCFDSADALRLASISEALERIPDPPRDGSVRERLEAWAQTARRRLRATDGLAAACLTDWPALPAGCRMMEGLLAVAADHAESTIRQCEIANAVFVYAVTRAQAERAVLARGSTRQLPAVEARPKQYPHLAALEHRFAVIDVDRHFAVGLDALLVGLLADGDR
ncbi:MAG: TetR/AcrR family transcriptional regulator C-terminal domain-containing protein [Acidimicrobiia bacterium]